MVKKLKYKEVLEEAGQLKLDLGTGRGAKKPQGFIGVDKIKHAGVDKVFDLRKPWPWKTRSVSEVNMDYLLQYLTQEERVHVLNELYRVMKPGAKALVIVPHQFASKAYGDFGIQWPPVSEMWFATLNKAWRDAQNRVDTSGLTCDFDHTLGYGLHPSVATRNHEYQINACTFWKEAAQDIIATLVKK